MRSCRHCVGELQSQGGGHDDGRVLQCGLCGDRENGFDHDRESESDREHHCGYDDLLANEIVRDGDRGDDDRESDHVHDDHVNDYGSHHVKRSSL